MFHLGLNYASLDIIAEKMSWLRLINNFLKAFFRFFHLSNFIGLLNKFYANLSLIRMCFFVLESLIDVCIFFRDMRMVVSANYRHQFHPVWSARQSNDEETKQNERH